MSLPQERPATFDELVELNATANTLSSRVLDRVNGFHKAVEAATREATERFSQLPRSARKTAIDHEVMARRRKLRSAMDLELAEPIRELGAARELLESQRPFFANLIATLDRETLGRPERDRFANTLQHAGPATLEQAALRALRDSDVHLGAAVIARLHQLPTNQRPFHAREIAERLQPEHVINMRRALRASSEAVDDAVTAVQTISQPGAATLAKIARGVRALRQESNDGES